MTKPTLYLLLMIAVLAAPAALAQNAQAPMSLDEAISTALRGQTDVLIARNNVSIARSRLTQARSDYLPSVSIENNAFVSGDDEGVLNRSTTGTALIAGLNIYDGGLREANVAGARYGVQGNEAALQRTRQAVVFDVTGAYYDVLRAKHLAEVADVNVKYNEELREQIAAQAELGDVAAADVLPVEAQLANAKITQLTAHTAVRNAALQLQSAIGIPPRPQFDVQEVTLTAEPKILPMEDYVSAAVRDRPDIAQAEAGVGAARSSVRSARISLYPRPVITADYQRSISGGFGSDSNRIVGGFVFDVFNGGANRAAYRQAQAERATAELQAQQLDRDIRTDVENAYLNLTNARERLAASEISLAAGQKNLEAQQARYAADVAITLDVLNAQAQYVQAQANAVQARYDYYTAIAQLEFAVGRQGGTDGEPKAQAK